MRKAIGFRLDEEKIEKTVVIESYTIKHSGFHIVEPRRVFEKKFPDDFRSKDLGDLFIQLGNKLKEEKLDITNLEIISRFHNNINDVGRTFEVELQYDVVEDR